MLSFNSSFFNQSTLYSMSSRSCQHGNANGQEQLEQDRWAYQRLGQSLKVHVGAELPPEQSVEEAKPLFDVGAIVDTVMGHIANRIGEAQQGGADDEALAGMFEAARSGVETGFSQAREQIESLGKLDDDLATNIDAAETGIQDGINELEEEVLPSSAAPTSNTDEATQASGEDEPATPSVPDPEPINYAEYAKVYERTRNQFSFEVKTQEGDVVKIYAMADQSMYGEIERGQDEFGSYLNASMLEDSKDGFRFKVKGDINDEEMAAIESLMMQVNALSEEFYSGDLNTAFDMAMELTSDADQIAEFSLNLKQTYTRAFEYGEFSSPAMTQYAAPALPKGLAQPLGDFASGVKQAYETAKFFQEPRQLLEGLFEQMDTRSQMTELLKPMLNQLNA